MKKLVLLLIIFCALAALVFADIGPAPKAPKITVFLVKNGAAYEGDISLKYVCDEKGQLSSWGSKQPTYK